jgi:predicted nucleotidyltransferase
MAILLRQPDREHSMAELVESVGADRESVHRALRRAISAQLVTRRGVGRQFLYAADPTGPFFEEVRSLAEKTSGLEHLLAEALRQVGPPVVSVAFVFGSRATGRDRPGSDIDLMVIGCATRFELATILADAKRTAGRPVNALAYPRAEVERRLRDGDAFFLEVWASPKTMLVGSEADLPGVGDSDETVSEPRG